MPAVRQAARDNRKNPITTERLLWNALRDRQFFGRKFRRQHPVGPFILDFYCVEARLAIEIDGGIHDAQKQADKDRQTAIEALNIRFLRIPAQIVANDIRRALQMIERAILDCPSPEQRERGQG
jgi:very-short-patch-repair endonuclease